MDGAGRKYKGTGKCWDLRPQMPLCGSFPYELIPHSRIQEYPYGKTMRGDIDVTLAPYCVDPKSSNVAKVLSLSRRSGIALDHGCGQGALRPMIEAAGFKYVGADNESGTRAEQWGGARYGGGATHLCDLHRLPFADNSFDFAVSYSVFEHLQHPHVAARELFRVMNHGAIGFVAIASLIPFHMDSFHHHTHFGTHALLRSAGFHVDEVAGSNWNGYRAIGELDGLPGPRFIRRLVGSIAYGAHRLLWRLRAIRQGRDQAQDETTRHNMMAGIIRAVVYKSSDQEQAAARQ